MIRINVHEAKTHLSRYLDAIEAGEVVVLCRRNVAIAEIRAVARTPDVARVPGAGAALFGAFTLEDAFFDPLPANLMTALTGGGA